VSASSSATGFPRGGTNATPVTDQQNHSQQANGFGDFSGSAAADSTIGPQSASATASASQTSSLAASGFSASGSIVADTVFGLDGPASATTASLFQISFSVAQAETFTFTADLTGANDLAEPGATSALIQLTDASGNNLFSPISSVNVSNDSFSGTLDAGTYSFDLSVKAASDDESKNFVNYNVALTDGAQDPSGTGVTSGTAVPLPSSGVMALVMLSGLAVIETARRRLPAWIRVSMI
jgi:hypothetical protein